MQTNTFLTMTTLDYLQLYTKSLNELWYEIRQPKTMGETVITVKVDDVDEFDTEYLDDAISKALEENVVIREEIQNIRSCPRGLYSGTCYFWYKNQDIDINHIIMSVCNAKIVMNETTMIRNCLPQFAMILLQQLHPLKIAHLILQYDVLNDAFILMLQDILFRVRNETPMTFAWPIDEEMKLFDKNDVSYDVAYAPFIENDECITVNIELMSDGYVKLHINTDGWDKTNPTFWNKLKVKALDCITCAYNINKAKKVWSEKEGPLLWDIRPHPLAQYKNNEYKLNISKVMHICNRKLHFDMNKSSQIFTALHLLSTWKSQKIFDSRDDEVFIDIVIAKKLSREFAKEILQVIASSLEISTKLVEPISNDDCFEILVKLQREPCPLTGLPTSKFIS